METWIKTSLILCMVGFLTEFRPIDSYYTQYLVGPWKNFTEEQVNQQIYPVTTYSQLSVVVLVFLVTDILRYKPMIILLGFSISATSILTLVGMDIVTFQISSVFFGMYLASMVAYFTYIYAKVDRKHYQKVTSHAQVAILLGRLSSSVVGQLLVSSNLMDYHQLNYITITAVLLGMVWSIFLPPAQRSIYFHKGSKPDGTDGEDNETGASFLPFTVALSPSTRERCAMACRHLWKDFRFAYTNLHVVKWSFWWALATGGYYQIFLYIQLLWETIIIESPGLTSEMQGMVYASYTAIGAVAAFACGWLRVNWEVLGEATLALCALLQGSALIIASRSTLLTSAYVGYVTFAVLYHTMITIVNAEIAKHINEDSYGLIFGVNTFFALLLQTVLTLVVAGEGGFALPPRDQFLVYGSCFILLGCLFAAMAVFLLCSGKLRNKPLWLSKEPSRPQT